MNLRTCWRVTALAGRPACRLRIRTTLTGHCFCVKRQGGSNPPAPPLMTGFWRDCFKRVNVHDVLYAHRPSFLTLRLFEQVLEEVHRTALTSRLGMLCRHVAILATCRHSSSVHRYHCFSFFFRPVYDCFGRYRRYCGWILICLR